MSDLILSWLNTSLPLSQPILSFQRDFSNGYLFGEILTKYNQQLNFSSFINKSDKDSKLNNFTLLFPTFQSLRISFNTNIVMDIIQEKEGVAKKVLYEMKMQLERGNQGGAGYKTGVTPLKRVEVGKQKKDELDSKLFRRGLQVRHKAQKKINEEEVLKKFSNFYQQEKEKERIVRENQMKEIQMRNEHIRNKMRSDFKRVQEFSRGWEREGVKNWGGNMEVRRNQETKDREWRVKMEAKGKEGRKGREEREGKEVERDIEEFEAKFGKTGMEVEGEVQHPHPQQYQQKSSIQFTSKLRPSSSKPQLKRPPSTHKSPTTSLKPPPSAPALSATSTDYNRKQRDKKRRMMIVSQSHHQHLISLQRRQQELLFSLHQISKQQKEIEYQIWRARQNKTIIIENRKLREEGYQEKEEVRRLNGEWKNEELLRVMREEHEEDVEKGMKKGRALEVERKVEQRKGVYGRLEEDVLGLLEIVEKCYEYCQDKDSEEIQGGFFDGLMEQFIQQQPEPCAPSPIDSKELQNYIQSLGQWSFPVERLNSQPTSPTLQNALPATPTNNYYLGNILKTIYTKTCPQQQLEEPKGKVEFGICLLGLECAGKKTVAKHLGELFEMVIIDPEEVLETLVSKIVGLGEQEIAQLDGEIQELYQLTLKGQPLPDTLLHHFIHLRILSSPRFILINYPQTYSQALLLTQSLSSITPADHSPPTLLTHQLSELHKLVQSTPETIKKWELKPCGLDLVLWLDVEEGKSLDRWMGMRKLEGKEVHVGEEELRGCDIGKVKGGRNQGRGVVERNCWVGGGKEDLKEWFERFGLKVKVKEGTKDGEGEEGDEKSSICWKEIDSNRQLIDTISDSISTVHTFLTLKTQHTQSLLAHQQSLLDQQQSLLLLEQQKAALRLKCLPTSPSVISSHLALALSNPALPPPLLSLFSSTYTTISQHLLTSYYHIFSNLRQQKTSITLQLSQQKRRFLSQLNRLDRKPPLLKQFQMSYNQFIQENKDMVEEGQTKEELHQRVDDLEEELREIIEEKKGNCEEVRSGFEGSGWLETEMEYLYGNVLGLVQVEVERSWVSQQVISDYYTARYSLESSVLNDFQTEFQVDSSLQLIAGTEFPRVEKLIQQAFRVWNRQDPETPGDDKNKKPGTTKPPVPKKDDKKLAKKNAEVQQKRDPTPQQLEMSSALNTEKSIFRYRINILRQFLKQELATLKSLAQTFSKSLTTLIVYTEKTQLSTLTQLTTLIRSHIESQSPIQQQLQLQTFDILHHHSLLNFSDPQPIIKPAKQLISKDKFTIGNLAYMINNLLEQGERDTKRIVNHKLLMVLVRTTGHRQTCLRLPEGWRGHGMEEYDVMIRGLDFAGTGFVLLENLFVFMVLCNLKVPGREEMARWRERLEERGDQKGFIEKQEFLETEAWFDESEKQPEEINTYYFDRPRQLKELLFEQLKVKETRGEGNGDPEKMSINKLITYVGLEQFSRGKKEGQTYYGYMMNK